MHTLCTHPWILPTLLLIFDDSLFVRPLGYSQSLLFQGLLPLLKLCTNLMGMMSLI